MAVMGGPACTDDGSGCYPGDVTKWSGTWVAPENNVYPGQCTAAQIQTAYEECVSAPSSSACNTWMQTNEACWLCLVTLISSPSWGAAIRVGPTLTLNQVGCFYLAEPCNLACAEATLLNQQCSWAACPLNPTTCPSSATGAITACEQRATTSCGCMEYNAAATCWGEVIGDPSHHPAVGLCALTVPDFETAFVTVSQYMCGFPPTDGGPADAADQ